MKKVFAGALALILCFCASTGVQAEWSKIEKIVFELGISFSFPMSDNSLYQQTMITLEKTDGRYYGWSIPGICVNHWKYGKDWAKTVRDAMEEASEIYDAEINCAWEFGLMDNDITLTWNYPKYNVAIWSMDKPDNFDEPVSYMEAMREALGSDIGLSSREEIQVEELTFGENGGGYGYTAKTAYGIVTYPIAGMHVLYNDRVLLIEVSIKTLEADHDEKSDTAVRDEMNQILYGIAQSIQEV